MDNWTRICQRKHKLYYDFAVVWAVSALVTENQSPS